MKKLLFIPLIFLFACKEEDSVILNKDFITIDNIQKNEDNSFEIRLKAPPTSKGKWPDVHFTSKFRFQAGDTLWSRYQLKEYNIDKITQANIENAALKDSIQLINMRLQKAELENELLKNNYFSTLQSKSK